MATCFAERITTFIDAGDECLTLILVHLLTRGCTVRNFGGDSQIFTVRIWRLIGVFCVHCGATLKALLAVMGIELKWVDLDELELFYPCLCRQ